MIKKHIDNTMSYHAFLFSLSAGLETCFDRKKVNVLFEKNRGYYKSLFEYGKLSFEKERISKLAAFATAEKLFSMEPHLANANNSETIKFIFNPQDDRFRDLVLKSDSGWELGIAYEKPITSHLRIVRGPEGADYANKWFGVDCSTDYYRNIDELLRPLEENKGFSWNKLYSDSNDKFCFLYRPVLDCFSKELEKLLTTIPAAPEKMIKNLFGSKDYYKVRLMNNDNQVKIQAYNLYKTLSPDSSPDLRFPTKLIEIGRKESNSGTLSDSILELFFDEGWTVKMRLHHVTTKIEPILRFDISIEDSRPYGLLQTYARWDSI